MKLVSYRLRVVDESGRLRTVDFSHEVYRDIAFVDGIYYCSVLESVWQTLLALRAQLRVWRFSLQRARFMTWGRFEQDIVEKLQAHRDWTTIALDLQTPASGWRTVGLVYRTPSGWIGFDAADRTGHVHATLTAALRFVVRLEKENFLHFTRIQIANALTIALVIGVVFLAASATPILFGMLHERFAQSKSIWAAALLVVAGSGVGAAFFLLKLRHTRFYGSVELGISCALLWSAAVSPGPTSTDFALKVMGAVYVFVRGATNIYELEKKRREKQQADDLETARSDKRTANTKFW